MKFEHFALNVEDPRAMSSWYVEQLSLQVVRQMQESPYTTFMADDSGTILLEIYNNPAAEVPDYAHMNPLLVHLAFVSANPAKEAERLQQAGAQLVSEQQFDDGTQLVMMRDPWGLAIQFCRRGEPMLRKPMPEQP